MDKVYCPYCNSEMKLEESLPFSGVYAYTCECGAVAPSEYDKDKAYAAAMRRQLQKPLTLEEAFERRILWLETAYCEKTIKNLFPAIKTQTAMYNGTACFTTDNGRIVRFNAFDYGKEWRCWATKPSDEERAAKWE